MSEIRSLTDDDLPALTRLVAPKIARTYPYETPTEANILPLLQTEESIENTRVMGLFERGTLRAALMAGVLSQNMTPCFYRLMFPGDGLIPWLAACEAVDGFRLFRHACDRLPRRVFACPDSGPLSRCCLFWTGMLPAAFAEETAALATAGFLPPVSEDWGVKERLWFMHTIPDGLAQPTAPEGYVFARSEGDAGVSSLTVRIGDRVVGECRIGPAMLFGREYPGHALVQWLGVDEGHRGHRLGEALLTAQLHWARERGTRVMVLTTHAGRPAHGLYRRVGFEGVSVSRLFARLR